MNTSQGRMLFALPFIGAVLAGCTTPPPAVPPTPLPGPIVKPTEPPPPSPQASEEGLQPEALAPRAANSETAEANEAVERALTPPSKTPIRECRPNPGGGVVQVHVKRDRARAAVSANEGGTNDARTRYCVLDSLSTVDAPDTLSHSSPSQRPARGFTSLITVQW
jgi:hypothetical protein